MPFKFRSNCDGRNSFLEHSNSINLMFKTVLKTQCNKLESVLKEKS